MTRPALFLDRDGTLMVDHGYVADPHDVALLPGVVQALADLQKAGYFLFLVSNQSGVARGLMTETQLTQVHERLTQILAEHDVRLDAAYYCLHGPDAGCSCRKPAPGMLLRAASEFDVDLGRSIMIGDKPTDVAVGRAVGCRTVHYAAADPEDADLVTTDWQEIRAWLLCQKDK
jgi:D,D-heptose 1,7-bisphosphate phosphatase